MSSPIMSGFNIAMQEFNDLTYTTSKQQKDLTDAKIERDASEMFWR